VAKYQQYLCVVSMAALALWQHHGGGSSGVCMTAASSNGVMPARRIV